MKQFSYCVDKEHGLSACLAEFQQNCPKQFSAVLVFVFTADPRANVIWDMMEEIHSKVPDALIAGSTSSGEMMSGDLRLHTTILNFMVFEKTRVNIHTYDFTKIHPDDAGSVLLGQCRPRKDLVSVGLLGTLKTCNVRPMFTMLAQLPPKVTVFGGGADTYQPDGVTYVFTNGALLKRGVLAICFESSALEVKITSHLGWKPLGRQMEITDMFGDNIITELDHQPAISVYEKYLDIRKNDDFVHDTMEFPVLLERNGHLLARLPNACTNDGALIFSADFQIGEKIWLAYGDPNEILRLSRETQKSICDFVPEGVVVFSCVSRRAFLRNDMQADLDFFHQMDVPSAGIYTYGEISRIGRRVEVLNVTMVSVSFREGPADGSMKLREDYTPPALRDSLSFVQRMARFIEATTKELEEANVKLERIAAQDRLTELFNRGEMEKILRNEMDSPLVKLRPLSVVMLDLDNFKQINDTYGHQVGDKVLKFAADSLRKNIRQGDSAGRWGGEEFLLLLPGADLESAAGVAERIRSMLAETPVLPGGKCVTASFGVAEYHPGEIYGNFYRRLDSMLYEAKNGGRNCVIYREYKPNKEL